MSHYEIRRRELLGSRKRRPRRCDVLRQLREDARRATARARMVAAANRLEAVL
jgi:hypothetical protein